MMHQLENFVSIRIFAVSADQDEAKGVFDSFFKEVQKYGQIELKKIEQYWKNGEQFEILLNLFPKGDVRDVTPQLTKCLSSGWEISSDSYVWNYSEGNSIIDERIKWVNIEVIEI